MLTDERLKQLMQQVGMPNSTSLYQALRQCDMEATLAERERCAQLCEEAIGHITDTPLSDCAAAIRAS